ncbi:MAG TPA: DUF1318 domain-containing protein [Spirochaetota bacterium]
MRERFHFIIAGIFMCITGCVIAPPEIRLTGEKTLVENQIIGEYREIEEDAWAISSVKTGIQRQQGVQVLSGDDIFVKAMQIRELNEPSLRKYKDEGSVGEGNNGYVAYMKSDRYEKDLDARKTLLGIVEDENRARHTVFERSLVVTAKGKPSEEEIAQLGKKFAADEQARALTNDWIQGSDGKWQRKK